jgi:hypothetical protein
MLKQWKLSCEAFSVPNHRGLVLENGILAAKYASKWGLEDEMTRSHMKKAKRGGYTPWDLLRVGLSVYDGEPSISLTPSEAGSLFRSYAQSFQGRSQLFWTKELKGFLFDGSYDGDYELD